MLWHDLVLSRNQWFGIIINSAIYFFLLVFLLRKHAQSKQKTIFSFPYLNHLDTPEDLTPKSIWGLKISHVGELKDIPKVEVIAVSGDQVSYWMSETFPYQTSPAEVFLYMYKRLY